MDEYLRRAGLRQPSVTSVPVNLLLLMTITATMSTSEDDLVFEASEPDAVFSGIMGRPHEAGRLTALLLEPGTSSRARYDYVVCTCRFYITFDVN